MANHIQRHDFLQKIADDIPDCTKVGGISSNEIRFAKKYKLIPHFQMMLEVPADILNTSLAVKTCVSSKKYTKNTYRVMWMLVYKAMIPNIT